MNNVERPEKERGETRDKMLSLRLTGTEWARLEERARQDGVTVREYARRTLLSAPGSKRAAGAALGFETIQSLNRIGSLLHTLATDLQLEGQGSLPDEVLLVSRHIETLLDEALGYGPESRG